MPCLRKSLISLTRECERESDSLGITTGSDSSLKRRVEGEGEGFFDMSILSDSRHDLPAKVAKKF